MKPAWRLVLWSTAIVSCPILMVSETHRFTPTVYYSTYSFAHPPALRIKPGDRVITKTIDAGGSDENGKQVASIGANPEIGPFYIEGAEPGENGNVVHAREPRQKFGTLFFRGEGTSFPF